MFAQLFNQFSEQAKAFNEQAAFSEPVMQFNRLLVSQTEKVSQKQLELVAKYSTYNLQSLVKFCQATNVEELKKVASDEMSDTKYSQDLMKDSRELIELARDLGNQWQSYFISVVPNTDSK